MNDPYTVLQLKHNASPAQIKNAYRRLAKEYHPDVSDHPDAEERFIEITEAYERLQSNEPLEELRDALRTETRDTWEEDRRKRAREYARMRYEEFVANNSAFKRAWYYEPIRFAIYIVIGIFYVLGAAVTIAPIMFWARNGFGLGYIWTLLFTIFGVSIIKSTNNFQKEVKPYFDNYQRG